MKFIRSNVQQLTGIWMVVPESLKGHIPIYIIAMVWLESDLNGQDSSRCTIWTLLCPITNVAWYFEKFRIFPITLLLDNFSARITMIAVLGG